MITNIIKFIIYITLIIENVYSHSFLLVQKMI